MADKQNIGDENVEEELKVWIDKDGIANIKIIRNFTIEDVKALMNEGRELARNLSEKPKILLDMTSGLNALSSQFRKEIGEQVKELVKDPGFKKVAVFGGNIIIRTVASFIITASGVRYIKVFNTQEKALKWLKE